MIIAVNFDGTIVENAYPMIGPEKPYAIDTLNKLSGDGHRVVLWTTRIGRELEDAVHWCFLNGVTLYAVNSNVNNLPLRTGVLALPRERRLSILEKSPKIAADVFIDSCNVGGLPPWPEIYDMISVTAKKREFLTNVKNRDNSFREKIKKKFGRQPNFRGAGSGTRTHTRKAQDPKSCLSTNFNIPARRVQR